MLPTTASQKAKSPVAKVFKMITNLKLKNFKIINELDLKCAPLTLLTGINGTGKSSVFQALLMLRQTVEADDLRSGVATLNGPLISLNSDLHRTSSSIVEFELSDHRIPTPCEILLSAGRAHRQRGEGWADSWDSIVASIENAPSPPSIPSSWRKVPPLGGELVFVPADRTGPLISYERSDLKAQNSDLGPRGEFTVNYLSNASMEDLPQGDHRALGEYVSIGDTTDYWLEHISPGARLKIEDWDDEKPITASFAFDGSLFPVVNVGFGLTYALPVITALLMPRFTLCLLENPEAHLHPRGQSAMAELAARAAKAGVQVMVETHSDHFIDGIRIAVREGLLTPDDVAIHYFERQGNESVVRSPVIDSDGRLSEWPAGFFDQHEMNLVRLLRPIQGS